MAKNIKIGLVFRSNENWIGGTYYILNFISALKTLPKEIQPHLVVFVEDITKVDLIKQTAYPNLSFKPIHYQNYTIGLRIVNKITRILFKKNYLESKNYYKANVVKAIFPYSFEGSFQKINHKFFWIPDFQEHYLPHFFSIEEVKSRKENQLTYIQSQNPIIFSSKDAQKSFSEIYPQTQNKTYVINFAATHLSYNHLNINILKEKYNITSNYIIAPNQFWQHKNHQIIIDAVLLLKKENKVNFQIIFTGKEYDYRYPEYTQNLKKFVKENDLENEIKFLGFIDREDQLQLMNHSLVVIQPSFFEGWSTVVEDAKSMSQYIIVSNLAVHKEQLENYPNKSFFDPRKSEELASLLISLSLENLPKKMYDYQEDITKFANTFFNTIKNLK